MFNMFQVLLETTVRLLTCSSFSLSEELLAREVFAECFLDHLHFPLTSNRILSEANVLFISIISFVASKIEWSNGQMKDKKPLSSKHDGSTLGISVFVIWYLFDQWQRQVQKTIKYSHPGVMVKLPLPHLLKQEQLGHRIMILTQAD